MSAAEPAPHLHTTGASAAPRRYASNAASSAARPSGNPRDPRRPARPDRPAPASIIVLTIIVLAIIVLAIIRTSRRRRPMTCRTSTHPLTQKAGGPDPPSGQSTGSLLA